jgi:hypothetical protein
VLTKSGKTLKSLVLTQDEQDAAGMWSSDYHFYADATSKEGK